MSRTIAIRTTAVAVGLLLLGAGYLYAVRGPALLLDLSALAGMICF